MEKKYLTATKYLVLLAITMISLSTFVSALAMSLSPSKAYPLLLSPGETVEVPVNLQNALGDKDVTVRLSVSKGGEIASTPATDFVLKAGSSDIKTIVKVFVSDDVKVGTEYTVTLDMNTVNNAQSGQVSFGSAMDWTFPVKVVAPKPQVGELPAVSQDNWITLLVVVVVLALILWMVRKYTKKGKKR